MKRLICVLLALWMLCACSTSVSYTYEVETGDTITVSLDTSSDYSLSNELPFVVSKDKEEDTYGSFVDSSYYDAYLDAIKEDTNSEILKQGTIQNGSYIFYTYNEEEFNYIIKLDNSNTVIVLGNHISKENAETIFSLLSFELN